MGTTQKERMKKMETQTKTLRGEIMTRIATGMAFLMLLATAGCGGGSENPLGATGVMSSAPTKAQSDGGLTDPTARRSAKPDKNTVDFSGVNWEWNAARTHLEPDGIDRTLG